MHQELMDVAYEKFDENMSHEDWQKTLTPIEKKAVVLGNLNYQVQNGGFFQWVDNGYVTDIKFLISVLKEMDTEVSKNVIKLLEDIKPFVIPNAVNRGCFGNYLNLDYEDIRENIDFHYLDDEYYKFNEKFEEECEEYLTRLSQQK